jgi:sodium transport system permease protein
MLLATEFLFFLAPVVLYAWLKGFSARETFALRPPLWRALAGALLVGVSGWTIGGGLLVRLLPPPDSLVKALEKILLIEDKPAPLWEAWLLVGLVPALCEELFFRGFLQSGFRRLGQWPAILVTALLFGLAHSSIYRLLPTMFLGLLFGYLVWRTGSIAAGILAHLLNNGLMATLARSGEFLSWLGLASAKEVPWSIIAGGAVVLAAGLALARSAPRAPEGVGATAGG